MIEVIECNPLYFPKGNEYGETWQPYYKATLNGVSAFGRTPEDAKNNLAKELSK